MDRTCRSRLERIGQLIQELDWATLDALAQISETDFIIISALGRFDWRDPHFNWGDIIVNAHNKPASRAYQTECRNRAIWRVLLLHYCEEIYDTLSENINEHMAPIFALRWLCHRNNDTPLSGFRTGHRYAWDRLMQHNQAVDQNLPSPFEVEPPFTLPSIPIQFEHRPHNLLQDEATEIALTVLFESDPSLLADLVPFCNYVFERHRRQFFRHRLLAHFP